MKDKIAFVGAGNISWSLIPAMQKIGYKVSQLISRNEEKLNLFSKTYQIESYALDVKELAKDADFVFLTVPDQTIEHIANILPLRKVIVVHTSGSIPLQSLSALGNQIGVFYPMQTFTVQKQVDMKEVSIFIEGGTHEVNRKLLSLGNRISRKVFEMNSEDRLRLHLGAVMASNFSNYLYQLINDVVPQREAIDFSIYEGLIREQLDKALTFGPENVQTGPAIRGDQITINKHLKLLEKSPEVRKLYLRISQMINRDISP